MLAKQHEYYNFSTSQAQRQVPRFRKQRFGRRAFFISTVEAASYLLFIRYI